MIKSCLKWMDRSVKEIGRKSNCDNSNPRLLQTFRARQDLQSSGSKAVKQESLWELERKRTASQAWVPWMHLVKVPQEIMKWHQI